MRPYGELRLSNFGVIIVLKIENHDEGKDATEREGSKRFIIKCLSVERVLHIVILASFSFFILWILFCGT